MLPFKKILCPTDFSEPALRTLHKAAEIAARCGGELYLLYVLADPATSGSEAVEEPDTMRQSLRDLIRDYVPSPLQAQPLVERGDVTAEIIRVAKEQHIDLIMLATHGSTGWREFALGSVTDEVVRLAPCPVFVIPALQG